MIGDNSERDMFISMEGVEVSRERNGYMGEQDITKEALDYNLQIY